MDILSTQTLQLPAPPHFSTQDSAAYSVRWLFILLLIGSWLLHY